MNNKGSSVYYKSNGKNYSAHVYRSIDIAIPDNTLLKASKVADFTLDSFSDVLNQKKQPLNLEPFPPSIRYISEDQSVIVFERPPAYKTFSYTYAAQANSHYDQVDKFLYRVPVPWQVYVIYVDHNFQVINLFMFFRAAPLANITDSLGLPFMANFYQDGRVCFATLAKAQEEKMSSIQSVCANAYNAIWSTGFNADTHKALEAYMHDGYWAKFFKANAARQTKDDVSSLYANLENMSLEAIQMMMERKTPSPGFTLRELVESKVALENNSNVSRIASTSVTMAQLALDSQ